MSTYYRTLIVRNNKKEEKFHETREEAVKEYEDAAIRDFIWKIGSHKEPMEKRIKAVKDNVHILMDRLATLEEDVKEFNSSS